MHSIYSWIALWYAIASLIAFVTYGIDKSKSMRKTRRIPESTLHVMELLGGWPGALVAQNVFKHKRRKTSFMVLFWMIVIAHIAMWGYWIFRPR